MSTALFSLLGMLCPQCDLLNPAGAPRCTACNADLLGPGTSAAPSRQAQPSRPAAKGEGAPNADSEAITLPGAPFPDGLRPRPAASTNQPTPLGTYRRQIPVLEHHEPTPLPGGQPPIPLKARVQPAGTPFVLSVLTGPRRGQRLRLAPHTVIGRTRGTLLLPEDPFISPQHATLWVREGRLHVRDEGSASGVFVSISTQELIASGSYFCVGNRLFCYLGALPPAAISPGGTVIYGAPLPPGGTCFGVEERLMGGRSGAAFVTAQPLISIGRKNCDLSFPDDETLAPRHCELAPISDGAVLRDLSGGLGTLVRLQSAVERPIKLREQVRIGQALMRFEAAEPAK